MVIPPEIVARVKDDFFIHKLPKTVIARSNQISVRKVYSIIDDVKHNRVRERKKYDSSSRQILNEHHLIKVEHYLSQVNVNATLNELLKECYLPSVTPSALSRFLRKYNIRTLASRKNKSLNEKLNEKETQARNDLSNLLKDLDSNLALLVDKMKADQEGNPQSSSEDDASTEKELITAIEKKIEMLAKNLNPN